MKRILSQTSALFLAFIMFLVLLTGCSFDLNFGSREAMASETPEVGEGDMAPASFKSLDALRSAVSRAKPGEAFDLHSLSYCFELNETPPEYQLSAVTVKSVYCCLTYFKTDDILPDETYIASDWIDLEWYRLSSASDLKNALDAYGNDTPFLQCKNDPNYYYKKLTTCTTVIWTQDDHLFHANVPLSFTEDDILKYCIAKRVELKPE